LLCMLLMGMSSVLGAQSTSFDFMLIGTSSRAGAMGEAATAVSGDVGAAYFNPASAGLMHKTEFSFMHIKYLTDATLEQFSFITRTSRVSYGTGLYLGKIANIARRGDTPTDNPTYFDEHNFTGSIFWAIQLNQHLSLGNSIKLAYEKIDLSSASALALDFGVFYTLTPEIALGSSIRNLGTRPKFVDVAFDLPLEFRAGVSYRTPQESRFKGFLLSSDFVKPRWGNRDSKIDFGAEYNYQNLVALRIGYSDGYDSRGISAGGGISYQRYFFDYAFIPSKNNLTSTQRFTLRIRI
jgi:hypothetical protein